MKSGCRFAVAAAALLSFTTFSRAQFGSNSEFALGVGYAHIQVGGSSSELNSMDAWRFEPVLSFSPFEKFHQLRLGCSLGVSMVLDNTSRTIISNDASLFVNVSSSIPFVLLEPELRLSWRQDFQDTFFIEPGIGLGGAIGELHMTSDTQSLDKWDSTFAIRGFLNVGFAVTGGIAGFQLSYMHGGNLDFGRNARGNVDQIYIGVFGALVF